jgi:putative ABC transport system permease protein
MLLNYLKIAVRSLRKRMGVTAINVAGLSIGMAACLLIGLWVEHEMSYDDFHPEAERVVRVRTDFSGIGQEKTRLAKSSAALAGTLQRTVPSVQSVARITQPYPVVVNHGTESFTDTRVLMADSSFFDVFGGFEMLHGSRSASLDEENAVVLTASTARRIFGRTDAVGETIEVGELVARVTGTPTARVTGVMADVPETSHVHFDAVAAVQRVPPVYRGNWSGFAFYTYAKLVDGASLADFRTQLSDLAQEYAAASIRDRFDLTNDQFHYRLFAQPLPSIHLHSDLLEEIEPTGSVTTVAAFSVIGLLTLLVACINFINLATARASERATEVGVRKSLGAAQRQLAGQFLGEAVLVTLTAAVVAAGLTSLAFPLFNQIAGTSMGLEQVLRPSVVAGSLVLVGVVGLVSGGYPALVLSRFAPATVLKGSGRNSSGGEGRRLRQGLVVFQFAVSIVLIAGTLTAWQQFDYVQTKRLGIAKDRVVEIEQADRLGTRQPAFLDRIRSLPGVEAAGAGGALFGEVGGNGFTPNQAPSAESEMLNHYQVGPRFVETMDLTLLAGRSFDPARPADSLATILNESAARAYGWTPQEALGNTLSADTTWTVIGVVEDFHYQSMRQRVKPLGLFLRLPNPDGRAPETVYARLTPGDRSATVDRLKGTWEEMAASAPFQYAFLDRSYASLHRDVQRASALFALFAGLAIVIACLGLFGLATYTVQRRAKEIGIRKALGATAAQVVRLLSKEFLALVGAAAVAGLPVAYLAMQRWLADFAYRIDLGAGVFLSAAAAAGLIAFLAVSTQALKAARLDPATTLRDE